MTIDEKKRKKGKKGKEEKNAAGEELQVASPPGFLYRLVNHSQGRWYFYNDTKDYVMVVTGYFGPKSLMTCLPPAKMWREMPSGLVLMELVVEPLKTVPMLEGEPKDGFDLRFNAVPVKEAGHLV
ncbi:calpain-like cysteine peptidase [Angomonas deanei]|uniref:DUF1935 domain-containing protein n=1 Tax=Angomonas deanei TaxID=59799 RepID=A0A7G2C5U4_9TRYP|nr:calpain-like cysteine peptidase [Angomonas deanei]CAD2215168.1 Domain of unknown function (DUF1935), putative [Angomonas deanei]|eukprot:EPY41474.1 calpain-like cysteine peptidase [Angomonas deanei]